VFTGTGKLTGVPFSRPMPLVSIPEPFHHPDWLYEIKHDGFRALAIVEGHRCCLISRRGHVFTKWDVLGIEISHSRMTPGGTARVSVLPGRTVGMDARASGVYSARRAWRRRRFFLMRPFFAPAGALSRRRHAMQRRR